jgi:hypothetical protein
MKTRIAKIQQNLSSLLLPGQHYELRALTGEAPLSGVFNDWGLMAAHALALEAEHFAVYWGINPVEKEATNDTARGRATCAKDVIRRHYFAVDCDPIKAVKGGCSTDAEKAASWEVAKVVLKELRALGWPEPTVCDSGNGYHLLYHIDLPADDGGIVQRCLLALSARHTNDAVKVDTVLYDPPRILRLYGTLNCKGENTPERPHRYSILMRTGSDELVPLALLEALASEVPEIVKKPIADLDELLASVDGENGDLVKASQAARAKLKAEDVKKLLPRIKAYIAKMDPAIEGENGSKTAFAVACRLLIDFGLSVEQADPLFADYNERCVPPFSKEEVAHKLADAAEKAAEEPERVGLKLEEWLAADREERREKAEKKDTTKDELLAIVEKADLFHTSDNTAYARVKKDEHTETVAVKSDAFQYWLSHAYWQQTQGGVASKHLLEEATWHSLSLAHNAGREEEVFVRLAGKDGEEKRVYLDLCNEGWEAVEITAKDWKVVATPGVAFRRTPGMLLLPTPVRGGSIDELRPFLNLTSETDFRLVVSWLVSCFAPKGPYCLLALLGEQGSAKWPCRSIQAFDA